MPTYIKTGYWDKKAKAPDGWLDLNLFVQTIAPPTPPSTNIYNSDGTLTGNRFILGNNNTLTWRNVERFAIETPNNSTSNGFSVRIGDFNDPTSLSIDRNNIVLSKINIGIQTKFQVSNDLIFTQYNNNDIGLELDFANSVYQLGQITGNNATTLKIDDAAAFPVQVSGTNVSQTTSGASSGKFLKIKVDGVDYVIELKNPS
jgi:hypothetical protein